MKLKITPSTGNVFRDVGFRREEAEHLLVRADLMIQIQKLIVARGLKQKAAAKTLGVTQPRVSDLLRGRIDLFKYRCTHRYAGSTWCNRPSDRQGSSGGVKWFLSANKSRIMPCLIPFYNSPRMKHFLLLQLQGRVFFGSVALVAHILTAFAPLSTTASEPNPEVRYLLKIVQETTLSNQGWWQTEARQDIAEVQGRIGDVAGATATLTGIEEAFRDQAWGKVGRSLGRWGFIQEAISVSKRVDEPFRKAFIYEPAVEVALQKGDIEGTKQLAASLPEDSIHRENLLTTVAKHQVLRGDPRDAMALVLPLADRNPHALGAVLGELVKAGKEEVAKNLALGLSKEFHRDYAQLGMVWAQLGMDNLSAAVATAQSMSRNHAQATAWHDIAMAQRNKGRLDAARISLEQCAVAAKTMGPGWVRDDTYWRLAEAQAEVGDGSKAQETIARIESIGHRHSAIRDVVRARAEARAYTEAYDIARLLLDDDLQAFPNPYHELVRVAAEHGEFGVVESLIAKTPGKYHKEVVSGAAISWGRAGKRRELDSHLSQLSDEERDETLALFSRGQADVKEFDAARETLLQVRNNGWEKQYAFEELADAQSKSKQWVGAQKTANMANDRRIYRSVASKWIESEGAQSPLQWANETKDSMGKVYTLLGIIDGQIGLPKKSKPNLSGG